LKARLIAEKNLDILLQSIAHVKTKDDALYFVKQAIPCILHLENRTLLKLFFMLLCEGLSNAQGKLYDSYMGISSMEGGEVNFIEVISGIMNEEIFGSVMESKAQWKKPTESKKGENLKGGNNKY
jgi:hypothetical protein